MVFNTKATKNDEAARTLLVAGSQTPIVVLIQTRVNS